MKRERSGVFWDYSILWSDSRGAGMNYVEAIERLLARGHTQAGLERVLRLSPNYLSKVRHGAVTPSFQLAALLVVVERHPESIATINATDRPGVASKTTPEVRHAAPLDTLSLVPLLDGAGVRYGLLGLPAHVDVERDAAVDVKALDLVVHDADREVLQALRGAGLVASHHSSSLFRVREPDARVDEAITLHFPELPPLSQAFDDMERKMVCGVSAAVVSAKDTALWFLLNRREDGLSCAKRLVDSGAVDIRSLKTALNALNGLPASHSAFVLQVFDRDLAAKRLLELEGQ